jgi:glutaminyl-peptide cyclotransferase
VPRQKASGVACRAMGMALALVLATTPGCSREKESTDARPEIPPKLWEQFSGQNAFEEVARQVSFGPRPSGSPELEKARGHIVSTLKKHGWEVELQEFDATPVPGRGSIRFINIIARFSSKGARPAQRDTQRAIIGSHYDTKRMDGIRFVGANDGGSSTGALLELARVFATAPTLAERVELVFFDGEEALYQFGSAEEGPDGLVGSRHYARSLREGNRATQFRFAIVWDMIGDKDLNITLPRDTPPTLAGSLFAASEALGVRDKFGYFNGPILDDHVPLQVIARITAMDIIDFDYLPWHTSGDTLEQLSATSLETVGRTTVWVLVRELAK